MKKFTNHAIADALLRARLVSSDRVAKAQAAAKAEEPSLPVFSVTDFEKARRVEMNHVGGKKK